CVVKRATHLSKVISLVSRRNADEVSCGLPFRRDGCATRETRRRTDVDKYVSVDRPIVIRIDSNGETWSTSATISSDDLIVRAQPVQTSECQAVARILKRDSAEGVGRGSITGVGDELHRPRIGRCAGLDKSRRAEQRERSGADAWLKKEKTDRKRCEHTDGGCAHRRYPPLPDC